MMQKLILILSIFCIISNSFSEVAAKKGHLVIIGGGTRDDYIMQKFIELAGGNDAKIIIIPSASSDPLEAALYQRHQLENLGAENVKYILVNKESPDTSTILETVKNAKGIFFCGGDQSRLTKLLLNTALLKKIKDIYTAGGVIGGTSAGAAIMSEVMITGEELRNPDSTQAFNAIRKSNVEVKQGFGFITNAIIDQHFVKRKRHNRLISLVLEHPDLTGVAIDESTSIIVNPDDTFDVLGENTVLIYDARSAKNISTDKNDNLAAGNIILHILKSGERYDLRSGKIIP